MNRQLKPGAGTKVFVGLSGGVDSSVSAALLRQAGYDVTGVFIKVWQPDWMECSWREDRLDAMRAAVHLGIPFVTLDLEQEYKRDVVDYMISEYRAGRTPNPDVMCNRSVKFGAFFDWAMKQAKAGQEVFVATGHYARAVDGKLLKGIDDGKDQSYFLWTLSPKQLERTLFPVGGLPKSETRKLARKFGLPTADKPDSQGLCFIGKVDIKEFLSHYIERRTGDVLDESGKKIGSHDGAVFLTLGERRGFSIATTSPDSAPYFVVARDIERNTVTVSHRAPDGTLSIEKREFQIGQTNWIGLVPQQGTAYRARIRHLGELLPCTVDSVAASSARIVFEQPLIIAAGQSVVLYDKEQCLGGGIVL
jgi:tRNA-specific 2-thiouridylase